jgi:hypothetical protein
MALDDGKMNESPQYAERGGYEPQVPCLAIACVTLFLCLLLSMLAILYMLTQQF